MEPQSEITELIEKVKSGDENAATLLVRRYEPEIRRYIHYRLTSWSVRRFVDSLDICQSVLARFFRHIDVNEIDISTPQQLTALLKQIAQNRLIDVVAFQHAGKRDARKIDQGGSFTLASLADSSQEVQKLIEMQELASLIYGHCTDEDRNLIEQRMNGMNWAELAAQVGMTEDAVRKRVHRALSRAAQDAGLTTEK